MKICSQCKQSLTLDKFNKRSASKDGLQSKCAECNRAYYNNYYATTTNEKARLRNKSAAYKKEVRELLRSTKDKPCADCKTKYPYYVMQFDHLGDKSFTISTSMNYHSIEKIKVEISKCDVVCANCHAERTWQRAHGR